MGGTMVKLTAAGYKVHVIYGTGGNIAVRHDDLLRYCNDHSLVALACKQTDEEVDPEHIAAAVIADLKTWDRHHEPYAKETRWLAGMIRREEARNAAMACGVPLENIHFLDLSFYDSGKVKKKPLSLKDVEKGLTLRRSIDAGICLLYTSPSPRD